MKHTVLRLLGERPTRAASPFHVNNSELDRRGSFLARDLAAIPANWDIWNAPRPLSGHLTWSGDFQHGTLWAAIDPADDEAPLRIASSWRRYNIDMDAFRVLWLPREPTLREYAAELTRKYRDSAEDIALALQALTAPEGKPCPSPARQMSAWLEDSWHTEHRWQVVNE